MAGRGLQDIPFRVPDKWDASWYLKHIREVLRLVDIRNAIEGPGIEITGNSSEPATISATGGMIGLLDVPFVTMAPSPQLTAERILDGEGGVVTITDGGAGSTVEVGLQAYGVPYFKLVKSPGLSVLGNQLPNEDGLSPITGSQAGDVLWIRDVDGAGTLNVNFTNTPVWTGTHTWMNDTDTATVLVSNVSDPGAGVQISTSGSGENGINGQVAFWEESTLDYGFRFYMDGDPVNEAYFSLFTHQADLTGTETWRVTRTTQVTDFLKTIRIANGTSSVPALAFTDDTDLGFYRPSNDILGVRALEVRTSQAAAGAPVSLSIQNTNVTGSQELAFDLSNGTRIMRFGVSNAVSEAYLNIGTLASLNFIASGSNRLLFSSSGMRALDSIEVQLGTGGDLRLFHNGSNNFIRADNGYLAFLTGTTERFRIEQDGSWGLSGANYGTAGQVLTSNGSGAAPTWEDTGAGASDLAYADGYERASNTIANTTSETAFESLYTVPADTLLAGDVISFEARGFYSTDSSPSTLQIRVKFGGVTVLESDAFTTGASVADRGWSARGMLIFTGVGASATAECQGDARFSEAGGAAYLADLVNTAPVSLDTSTDADIEVTVEWGAADEDNTITLRQVAVWVEHPETVPPPDAGIQVFNSSGTFNVPAGVTAVDVLVVAGGGGGGSRQGGGGGAGGVVVSTVPVTPGGSVSVTVGAGGNGGTSGGRGSNGSNSSFGSDVEAEGGGGGGGRSTNNTGADGGGGGGGAPAAAGTAGANAGGAGTPGNGFPGGSSWVPVSLSSVAAGGGGGAGEDGEDASGDPATPGDGGDGIFISALSAYGDSGWFGGGGGGSRNAPGSGVGSGGAGGGGDGAVPLNATTTLTPAVAGQANTGGGGGGSFLTSENGAAGGSGVVIVVWPAGQLAPTINSLRALTCEV